MTLRHLARCVSAFASLAISVTAFAGNAPVGVKNPLFESLAIQPIQPMWTPLHAAGERAGLVFDFQALRQQAVQGQPIRLAHFPVSPGRSINLVVERFYVTNSQTQFMLGNGAGPGSPLNFDPESVILLHGTVEGYCQSSVFIGITPHHVNGWIDLGQGNEQFGIGSPREGGLPGQSVIFKGANGGQCTIPTCDVHEHHEPGFNPHLGNPIKVPQPGGVDDAQKGLRQIELAVDTDYEFFQLFPDKDSAAAYLVVLYAADSVIFMRDINTRLDLTFVRVWDTPTEPYEASLDDFREWWQDNMQSVKRDVAQMYSGRGDKPGGVAWLSSICNSNAYSFCGNAVGFFADPDTSSIWGYDPLVTAHELGHNFGSQHDDFYDIDDCGAPVSLQNPPRRGNIMGYCNQTVSGGMSVMDLRFHKITQKAMLDYIVTKTNNTCIVFDCNQNGINDTLDINGGVSQDANANGIPDECEDCNGNGKLDTIDIATGASTDLNNNGVPDECEPDCNGNNVPDLLDISSGTSQDKHGDNVPDECEADADNNGVSDYTQIMASMPLDRNRDRILDSVQDCDNNGVTDLVQLDHSHNAWAASQTAGVIREYLATTGVLMSTSTGATLNQPSDVLITPNRRILVADTANHRVVEFNKDNQFVKVLVAAGAGGLNNPRAMVLSSSGTLVIASGGTNSVLEFNLTTGAFIKTLVAAGAGSMQSPMGMTYGSDGHLYVSSSGNHRVLKFNGATGAFISTFVGPGSGGLVSPRGLVFNPVSGNLIVASFGSDQLLEYNSATGAFVKVWGSSGPNFLLDPWGVRVGPDGQIHVAINFTGETHVTKPRISVFNSKNGIWLRAFVLGNDTELFSPTGFDFMPDAGTDCNQNLLPDSCDIASGTSQDANLNGIPDECEDLCLADCDANGTLSIDDFICFQTLFAIGSMAADCDGDTQLTIDDFICYQTTFAIGC